MSDEKPSQKGIKLPYDVWEEHSKKKEELGLTWGQYVDEQSPSNLSKDDVRHAAYQGAKLAIQEYLEEKDAP